MASTQTMISAGQIRAARHLLGLSQAHVATAAGLSLPTFKRAESKQPVSVSRRTIHAIRAALESAGVEFIAKNGGGVGVRLKK
jgi:transcriptional regulator with XRE-family HTH domain